MKFKKFLKYLLLFLLIGCLSFLYSFSAKKNLNRKVVKFEVNFSEGSNHFLTHSMVNKLLIQKDTSLQNQAKSVIDLYSLENIVAKNPYVEKAAVFITIEGVLKTIIKQRTPIARIISSKGSYYVDKQGVKVPLSDNYTARVLLVSGINNEDEIAAILPLVKYIIEDNFLTEEIIGVQKNDIGEYQFSVRSGNYKIEFGKLNNIKIKFSKLKAFYNTTYKNKQIQNYKTINVKYHNQVVCSK